MAHLPAVVHDPGMLTIDIGQLAAVVRLRRRFSRAEWVAAVEGLRKAIPILGCRYERRLLRDRWSPVQTAPETLLSFSDHAPTDDGMHEVLQAPLDVLAGRTFALRIFEEPGASTLVLNMPHMLVDGNGLLVTLRELASQLIGRGATVPLATDRSFWQILRAVPWRRWPRVVAETWRDVASFLRLRRVSPWCQASSATAARTQRVHLDRSSSAAFFESCKRAGATINDGLVARALELAAPRAASRFVAAAYTVNLRKFLPTDQPIVGNLSGFVLVAADRQSCDGSPRFVSAIHSRIDEQKLGMPGVGSNLFALLPLGWLPHALLRAAAHGVRHAFLAMGKRAMVMTNVGPIDAYVAPFASLVDDAWVTPPTFPGMEAPISLASSYAGRLTVAVGGPRLADEEISRVAADWHRLLRST